MKTYIVRLLLLFQIGALSANAQSTQTYEMDGYLSGFRRQAKVMIEYRIDKNLISDSASIRNCRFKIKGRIARPVKVMLYIKELDDDGTLNYDKYMHRDHQWLYIEPGKITIKGKDSIRTAVIMGGKTQAEFSEWLRAMGTRVEHDSIEQAENIFIRKHPNSYVSWDIVCSRAIIIVPEKIEPLIAIMDPRFKASVEGKALLEAVALAKRVTKGQQELDFTEPDVHGNPVRLSSFKGSYVLLDFWASWCGPCRLENPNVLKAYQLYKDSGFTVVGVSLDKVRESWQKAVAEDAMPWTQLSGLKGWDDGAALLYGIKAIPQNVLIDPGGVIVDKNLRGEALLKKLAEIYQ